ncbi:hypothetical protein ACOSQ2_027353 [Xanthoceras sorbifolium]
MTTVQSYQEAFEKLSHRVDNLPENFLIGCFIAGLRDDIRLDVKVKQPQTRANTIGKKMTSNFRPSQALSTPRNSPPTAARLLGPFPNQKLSPHLRRITGQKARE